mmetsp:Transcript_3776/g.14491  ORF Transcript_3776/g.14491 Transcript_3776/m.14491 type:complete len:226 (+) Transcript_3776:3923-4600(+)
MTMTFAATAARPRSQPASLSWRPPASSSSSSSSSSHRHSSSSRLPFPPLHFLRTRARRLSVVELARAAFEAWTSSSWTSSTSPTSFVRPSPRLQSLPRRVTPASAPPRGQPWSTICSSCRPRSRRRVVPCGEPPPPWSAPRSAPPPPRVPPRASVPLAPPRSPPSPVANASRTSSPATPNTCESRRVSPPSSVARSPSTPSASSTFSRVPAALSIAPASSPVVSR